MDSMLFHCLPVVEKTEMVRKACVVERKTDGNTTTEDTLWIEMPGLAVSPQEDDAELFLIMALLPAMAEGRDIQVEGAVSRKLLSNLSEFRDVWHSWNPNLFKDIQFISSKVFETRK